MILLTEGDWLVTSPIARRMAQSRIRRLLLRCPPEHLEHLGQAPSAGSAVMPSSCWPAICTEPDLARE